MRFLCIVYKSTMCIYLYVFMSGHFHAGSTDSLSYSSFYVIQSFSMYIYRVVITLKAYQYASMYVRMTDLCVAYVWCDVSAISCDVLLYQLADRWPERVGAGFALDKRSEQEDSIRVSNYKHLQHSLPDS